MTESGFPGRPGPVDPDELLAAYALDAVSDEERALVERRLAESADARAEVEAYREAAGRLAETTPPVAPPPSLKASLFDRLDDAPQVGRRDGAAQAAPAADAPPALDEPARDAPFTSIESLFPPAADEPAPAAAEGTPAGPAERAARRRWFQRPAAIAASAQLRFNTQDAAHSIAPPHAHRRRYRRHIHRHRDPGRGDWSDVRGQDTDDTG